MYYTTVKPHYSSVKLPTQHVEALPSPDGAGKDIRRKHHKLAQHMVLGTCKEVCSLIPAMFFRLLLSLESYAGHERWL